MSNKLKVPFPTVAYAVQIKAMSNGAIAVETSEPTENQWKIGNLLLNTLNLIYQGLKPEDKLIQPVSLGDAAIDRIRRADG